MNKRIKKKKITLREKREQKNLKGFIKIIKRAVTRQIMMSSVPPTPSFEQQCQMIENAYRKVCENAGYTVSDILLSQSDHPGVINGEITLRPNFFPIDIEIIRERKLTPTESDIVAVQDTVDTSEIDIGTL
jgi:hypothetical protein